MNVENVVSQIRQIEAKIKEIEDRHKAELAPFNEFAEKARTKLLGYLNDNNQLNAKTKAGTAYKYERVSYRVDDIDEFKRHVIGSEDWDAINWSVNKTHSDAVMEKDKLLLPGVTRSVVVILGVTAPPKPRVKKAAIQVQDTELTQDDWAEIEGTLTTTNDAEVVE